MGLVRIATVRASADAIWFDSTEGLVQREFDLGKFNLCQRANHGPQRVARNRPHLESQRNGIVGQPITGRENERGARETRAFEVRRKGNDQDGLQDTEEGVTLDDDLLAVVPSVAAGEMVQVRPTRFRHASIAILAVEGGDPVRKPGRRQRAFLATGRDRQSGKIPPRGIGFPDHQHGDPFARTKRQRLIELQHAVVIGRFNRAHLQEIIHRPAVGSSRGDSRAVPSPAAP